MNSPRSILALALAGTLLGLAPAAASQTLAPMVGDPIPYRVSLPARAEISRDDGMVMAESGDLLVVVGAVDLMEEGDGNPLPVSDTEARRVMTGVFMGSDSLLIGMLEASMRRRDVELSDVVREIRTLGGQRSGYLRARLDCNCGHVGWVEMHVTVKDGIMYILTFTAEGEDRGRHEAVIARIHESFVLADAPPAGSRPRHRPVIRRRTSESR